MKSLKQWLPDILAVVLFAVISFAYFFPADIEGRILYRHDSSAGRGAGQEASEYYQRTGERTRWTNAVFSGMPTYQTAPSYKSTDTLAKVEKVYHLWLPDILAVVLFAVISFAYFFPADIEGRILYRHDSSAGRGAGQEASERQRRQVLRLRNRQISLLQMKFYWRQRRLLNRIRVLLPI